MMKAKKNSKVKFYPTSTAVKEAIKLFFVVGVIWFAVLFLVFGANGWAALAATPIALVLSIFTTLTLNTIFSQKMKNQ